jgi:hypothetical protein
MNGVYRKILESFDRPSGQRAATESILVAAPNPKCTRLSLLEM